MYKMAYTVPVWLYVVKKGRYTLEDLVQLTQASSHNIYMRMENLEVKKTKIKTIEGTWKNVYHWEGTSFYLEEAYKRSLEIAKQPGKRKTKK